MKGVCCIEFAASVRWFWRLCPDRGIQIGVTEIWGITVWWHDPSRLKDSLLFQRSAKGVCVIKYDKGAWRQGYRDEVILVYAYDFTCWFTLVCSLVFMGRGFLFRFLTTRKMVMKGFHFARRIRSGYPGIWLQGNPRLANMVNTGNSKLWNQI